MNPDIFVSGRIGVIGVGAMGRPLVTRLSRRGFDVAVYVRREELKAELEAEAITVEPDIQALAKGRDFVILYVYSDEQTRAVCFDDGLVDAMDRDAILIIHTTVSPRTVQAIGARAEARGVRVVDAGGAWAPAYTALGEMNLMVGGDPEDLARCMPVLETYAYPVHYAGPLGSGMCMKLVNNAAIGVHLQLASEVVRIGRELGLDSYRLLRGLTHCTGGSTAMRLMAGAVTEERFWAHGGPFIYKDLKVVEEMAAQLNLDLGLIGEMNRPLIESLAKQERD
ncbi:MULTISPECIES: NAD(P)-dependent oxidoreductase [unclassified Caballeronia]|uniref:NAD(P)-dependent oxidoreductase n=1 Tax=unclassified Caballeronia TaxID=2646786 RepID=UPI00285F72A2|nr:MULTISPECIES: NAD(P)-dependent oxidoreductase [unclassified Caballeronia]MDR5777155.1 NAD(P)-dependent oxidoreductase [Caballeronia sp. LZ002]MDR5852620.1 NAD(P)-dependent oxidoreductase [Caballeronia sp. LZ003]